MGRVGAEAVREGAIHAQPDEAAILDQSRGGWTTRVRRTFSAR